MSKSRILLIDDEESVRISGKYALEPYYDIITIETTAKALELLKAEKYDLVLLDMMIKGEGPESGLNMLKIIHREFKGLPVVILTGTVSWMQKAEELKLLGAVGFLFKPFGREEARAAVENTIGK